MFKDIIARMRSSKLYWLYRRQRGSINTVLFIIFMIVLSGLSIKEILLHEAEFNDVIAWSSPKLPWVVQLVSITRDFIAIVAVILAGVWTYYTFLKGRTFTPKIDIKIDLKHVVNSERTIATITIKFLNSGRVRVRPLSAPVGLKIAKPNKDTIDYVELPNIENVIHLAYAADDDPYLDPQDEMRIDVPILIDHKEYGVNKPDSLNILLDVDVLFVDSNLNSWKEHSILLVT